nr:MAG TPA: hypothetical protein [Caudoviricetes sp.]
MCNSLSHRYVISYLVWRTFSPSFYVRFSDYPIYNRVEDSWVYYILHFFKNKKHRFNTYALQRLRFFNFLVCHGINLLV